MVKASDNPDGNHDIKHNLTIALGRSIITHSLIYTLDFPYQLKFLPCIEITKHEVGPNMLIDFRMSKSELKM